ncbi:MAG: hypothetical protein COU08_00205 [Candidatus Harrisonbacteria bacterium CG10_big_fil_rev_8_21_14_0_10_42_17]|uniref:RNA polymerase subunit sigma-70 n=1 Tax=Candidatus Harrisonbacteria bacterium CG10_big_fil_rev_8_21_14_0_10_42_17 TaxID=1974584 RepID=A0A2M6WJ73_9BACT|nr:MAG: hypothetical protein COU08_00205 [Candidatus Harrisonbacteria bacterium CG10_big_fil_rev_8_21_14_0_10_42_17]
MLESEESLIKKAKSGDSDSFGELYDYYIPQIYRYVLLKVSNKTTAEDLVHEIFISAWKSIGRYEHKGFPFSSWLYQIARNQVIDHYRVKKTHSDIETVNEEFVKIDPDVSERMDAKLQWEKVKGAMQNLSQDQQDVLIMRFVEDMSHREIAEAIKKTEGAVRIIQHRAINELKNLLV